MKKLGIIGTGYMAKIIGQRARELNIESHCFSIDNNSVAGRVCDFFHYVNILDVDDLAKKCAEIGINGVVATTELTIFPAAYVANYIGLNGNDVKASKEITDKAIVREKIKKADGILQPNYWIFKDNTISTKIKYPVIVKPIAAGGKRGVCVVYSENNMKDALKEAMAVSKVEGAIVEEYLSEGKEYSVESLSYHGNHHIIQITEKISSGPPHCVELGHHQPASLSLEIRSKVEYAVTNALTAVEITNGPCHTEIKIIDNKVYLIEINGRPGGDHIAYPLTELSTGYPYISGIIRASLDELDEREIRIAKRNYCGVLFVTEQTSFLKLLFDKCDKEQWLYKKNFISDELKPITHNDGFNTNYFIYCCDEKKPDVITKLLEENR